MKYAVIEKVQCESCHYSAYRGSLDVHHRDGNHNNNAKENLQVLCSNCHRKLHAELRPRREIRIEKDKVKTKKGKIKKEKLRVFICEICGRRMWEYSPIGTHMVCDKCNDYTVWVENYISKKHDKFLSGSRDDYWAFEKEWYEHIGIYDRETPLMKVWIDMKKEKRRRGVEKYSK